MFALADQICDHSAASHRSPVERAVTHWKILATGYRGRLTELPDLTRTITTLEHNRLDW